MDFQQTYNDFRSSQSRKNGLTMNEKIEKLEEFYKFLEDNSSSSAVIEFKICKNCSSCNRDCNEVRIKGEDMPVACRKYRNPVYLKNTCPSFSPSAWTVEERDDAYEKGIML